MAAYFTSGFARFSVRIWSRTQAAGSYAVELMRERVLFFFEVNPLVAPVPCFILSLRCLALVAQGDRILVTRFFEMISGNLQGTLSPESVAADFNVDMFDWAPRKVWFWF